MIAQYPKHLALRVSNETEAKLRAVAAEREVSVSDLIRALIEEYL